MKRNKKNDTATGRGGFTLVELLVSVTLILLMMTLFAQIFTMATDSISRQKGIAENDQRARILTNTIRADFAKRTFRYGLPFYPGENSDLSVTSFGKRDGYIYMNGNDPVSGIDDILQFTVNSALLQEESDDTQFLGAASMLYDQLAEVNNEIRRTALRFNPNQPEADDGSLFPNGVAASTAAEVTYFVRNGGLYRRVMLLRNPLPAAGGDQEIAPRSTVGDHPYLLTENDGLTADAGGRFWYVRNPENITLGNFELGTSETASADRSNWNVTQSNDLWGHFDFSAIPLGTGGGGGSDPSIGAVLLGVDALANDSGILSLGNPRVRWGFNFYTGQSREHLAIGNPTFFGRFLHAETSDWRFNWPMAGARNEPDATTFSGTIIGSGNPMQIYDASGPSGTQLSIQPNGVISQFNGSSIAGNTASRGGPRAVEDVLLSHVHEFRVEIWDDRLGRFVTPGYGTVTGGTTESVGDYHIARCLQADVTNGQFHIGPLAPYTPSNTVPVLKQPHAFDTWHADLGSDPIYNFDGDATVDQLFEISPPYIALRVTPPLQPSGPTPTLVTDPVGSENISIRTVANGSIGTVLTTNQGYWEPNKSYSLNDVVFVPWDDTVPNGNGDSLFQYSELTRPEIGFHLAYRCVIAGTSDGSEPAWPTSAGQRVSETNVQWEAIDNRRPLKSIRVTIRFQEPSTEQIRQVALILPVTIDE